MSDRNWHSPGSDSDTLGAQWERIEADQPWAEQRATIPEQISAAGNLANVTPPVHNGHLARLAAALHESRRRQTPRVSRDHLHLVREA